MTGNYRAAKVAALDYSLLSAISAIRMKAVCIRFATVCARLVAHFLTYV
jgi:hypothetical protein